MRLVRHCGDGPHADLHERGVEAALGQVALGGATERRGKERGEKLVDHAAVLLGRAGASTLGRGPAAHERVGVGRERLAGPLAPVLGALVCDLPGDGLGLFGEAGRVADPLATLGEPPRKDAARGQPLVMAGAQKAQARAIVGAVALGKAPAPLDGLGAAEVLARSRGADDCQLAFDGEEQAALRT